MSITQDHATIGRYLPNLKTSRTRPTRRPWPFGKGGHWVASDELAVFVKEIEDVATLIGLTKEQTANRIQVFAELYFTGKCSNTSPEDENTLREMLFETLEFNKSIRDLRAKGANIPTDMHELRAELDADEALEAAGAAA